MTAVRRGARQPTPAVEFSVPDRAEPLWRVPGTPFATTVLVADLLPGTRAYAETYRDSLPILVIDTGPTEIQLSVPGDRIAPADLEIMALLLHAMETYRTALLPHLD